MKPFSLSAEKGSCFSLQQKKRSPGALRCLEIFQPLFLQIHFWCHCPFQIPITSMLQNLIVSQLSDALFFFFFFSLFSLCFIFDSFYCDIFKCLIFFSIMSNLLLIPYNVLFISYIIFSHL